MEVVRLFPPLKTKQQAIAITGGLSRPSKMPGHGYSIPAELCLTGARLRSMPGSVCASCYALKGRYAFPVVKAALQRRAASLGHPQWVEAMVLLIAKTGDRYFRWHDAGDLQGVWHLREIVEVAKRLPDVSFWLPTRERGIVKAYREQFGDTPANICVRISHTLVDSTGQDEIECTSSVVTSGATCPAHHQGNQCGDCRACWDPGVRHVSYRKH